MSTKRIGSICIAIVTCFTFTFASCSERGEQNTTANLEVWTVSGNEKIKLDGTYTDRYDSKKLELSIFQNERESAQIILTPNVNVSSYTVTMNDLKMSDGTVLSKDNFQLFHEKYLYVDTLKETQVTTGTGYYPDALVPYQTIVDCGENFINKDTNQGVWVEMRVPAEQQAGIYTGDFTVTVDGKNYIVPVEVEVYDYAIATTPQLVTAFVANWSEIAMAEMDASVELQEKYWDFMLDYRISIDLPGNPAIASVDDEGSNERFLKYATMVTLDERCNHYYIPYSSTSKVLEMENGTVGTATVVHEESFRARLRQMAEYSIENKINLFAKARTYFQFLDEFEGDMLYGANYTFDLASSICKEYSESFATELDWKDCDETFKAEVLEDLKNIQHISTGTLIEKYTTLGSTLCVELSAYDTVDSREAHAARAEKAQGSMWSYTTSGPHYPKAAYQIENILLSARLMSWMLYDYDVDGNLYWNIAMYGLSDGEGGNEMIQDYYANPLRYWGANGDGYLLYPGRPYSIDGPVASVRVQAIRDGSEDYDLLYDLEQYVLGRGATGDDFNSVLHLLTDHLYEGVACFTNSDLTEVFSDQRDKLATLLMMAQNTGTVIENYEVSSGVANFRVSAPSDTVLKLAGNTITNGVLSENGWMTYDIQIPLNQVQNALNLTATKGEYSYSIYFDLGAKVENIDISSLQGKITLSPDNAVKAMTTLDGVEALKVDFVAQTDAKYMVTLNAVSLGIDASKKVFTINVWYGGEEEVSCTLLNKCELSLAYSTLRTVTLKSGWNEIQIKVADFNCSTNGMLTQLRLRFDQDDSFSIALGNISIS